MTWNQWFAVFLALVGVFCLAVAAVVFVVEYRAGRHTPGRRRARGAPPDRR